MKDIKISILPWFIFSFFLPHYSSIWLQPFDSHSGYRPLLFPYKSIDGHILCCTLALSHIIRRHFQFHFILRHGSPTYDSRLWNGNLVLTSHFYKCERIINNLADIQFGRTNGKIVSFSNQVSRVYTLSNHTSSYLGPIQNVNIHIIYSNVYSLFPIFRVVVVFAIVFLSRTSFICADCVCVSVCVRAMFCSAWVLIEQTPIFTDIAAQQHSTLDWIDDNIGFPFWVCYMCLTTWNWWPVHTAHCTHIHTRFQ